AAFRGSAPNERVAFVFPARALPLDPARALPLDPASAGLRWTSRLPKGFLVRYYKLLVIA
ncbi:MAG: hypothetical protein NC192_06435, partial [Muribaculaceae bacterium]|nr:hypothetical protein [Muribaculaceae bacterium]